MLFLRLALVSAAIYVGFAIAIQIAILVVVKARGSFGVYASKPAWFAFFGALWAVSFWIAWRTSPMASLLSRR